MALSMLYRGAKKEFLASSRNREAVFRAAEKLYKRQEDEEVDQYPQIRFQRYLGHALEELTGSYGEACQVMGHGINFLNESTFQVVVSFPDPWAAASVLKAICQNCNQNEITFPLNISSTDIYKGFLSFSNNINLIDAPIVCEVSSLCLKIIDFQRIPKANLARITELLCTVAPANLERQEIVKNARVLAQGGRSNSSFFSSLPPETLVSITGHTRTEHFTQEDAEKISRDNFNKPKVSSGSSVI